MIFYICKHYSCRIYTQRMHKMLPTAVLLFSFTIFQWFTSFCHEQPLHGWQNKSSPESYVRKFIASSDTTGFENALKAINLNFVRLMTPTMVKLLLEGEKVAEKKHQKFLPGIYSLLRTYYLEKGDHSKNLEYSLREYHMISKAGKKAEMLWLLIDIGNLFFYERDYHQAGDFFREAEGIATRKGDKYALTVINLNYGLLAERTGRLREALQYHFQSVFFRKQTGNPKVLASNYIYIAGIYYLLNKPDSVIFYTRLAEDHYYHKGTEDGDLQTYLPSVLNKSYANYYLMLGKYDIAMEFLEKAKKHCIEHRLVYDYRDCVYSEAILYSNIKQYKKSIQLLTEILAFDKKNGVLHGQEEVYTLLVKSYKKLGDYKKATEALQNYNLIRDSIDKRGYHSQLNLMRTITSVYKKDQQLNENQQQLELKEIRNRQRLRERNTSYLILGIFAASKILLLIFFLKLIRNKKKLQRFHDKLVQQNNKIVENTMELEKSNEIRDRLFAVIAHDLRNPLNRVLMEFSVLEKSLPANAASNAMITLKETINLFESLLLWSKMDDKQTIYSPGRVELGQALGKIFHFFKTEVNARNISLKADDANLVAFADQNVLQTVLRNLVSNAVNAMGENGEIEIRQRDLNDGCMELTVTDSGPGFPEAIIRKFYSEKETKSLESKGFGLMLCKTLAKISHWTIDISNNPAGGAIVRISMPLYKERKTLQSCKPVGQLVLSPKWREKLAPVRSYQYYQISEIRKFIRSLGEIEEEDPQVWVSYVEAAVHEGSAEQFRELLVVLE